MGLKSGRGFRALAAAFRGAGNTVTAVEEARQSRFKEELGLSQISRKKSRLQDLIGTNPEGFEGLEDSIDPLTGEFDEMAMEIFKERGKSKRAGMLKEQTQTATRSRDRERIVDELKLDSMKQRRFLRAQGLKSKYFSDPDNPLKLEEIYERFRQGQEMPSIERSRRDTGWFGPEEYDYDVFDPIGEY